ncbi:MAG: FHA domain-containing protein [Polyangiaceae bacterium]|nr:FHA domain-containing protein [Polyangiaceae bacterium]
MASDRRRKRFDAGGNLKAPPVHDPDDDEPAVPLEDQFQRLEKARKSIEATFWYLEVEAPEAPPFRQGLLGKRFVIGRDPSSNLPLRGAGISRQHALLEHDEERDSWRISDAGSHNGTYVNGRRVREPTLLGPADTVHVGDWRLRLRADSNDDRREILRFATLRIQAPLLGRVRMARNAKPDRLVVLDGPAPRKEIRLDEGPVRLGPVKGSSLVPERGALAGLDVEVSPLPEPGTYELVVRGEGGLVAVNDVAVRKARLAPGNRLRLGRGAGAVTLEFRCSEPGARPGGGAASEAPPEAPPVPVIPSAEATPTETRQVDVQALRELVLSTAAGAAAFKSSRPDPAKAADPKTDDPASCDTRDLYVPRGRKPAPAPAPSVAPVPWAAEFGPPSPPDPAAEDAGQTPASPRSVASRGLPEQRRSTMIIAFLLGVLTISAAAALISRWGTWSEGESASQPPPVITQALGSNQPPLASAAPSVPSAPETVVAAPSAPSAPLAASARPSSEAPLPETAPSDKPPAPSALPPSSPPGAAAPKPSAGAPGVAARPRPSTPGASKPHAAGRGSADRESEERMREFLCRQKGKCD